MDTVDRSLEPIDASNLEAKIQEFYALFAEADAAEGPRKNELTSQAKDLLEAVFLAVLANPQLLKPAWLAMRSAGYEGDAAELAKNTVFRGRGMSENVLLEHVKQVSRDCIALSPEGWDLDGFLRELDTIFLNQRQNEKIKLVGKVPSPEKFADIDAIRAHIRGLLEQDGVVDTGKFEESILRIYDREMGKHWQQAQEEGREAEFVEKLPLGLSPATWEKFYGFYLYTLFSKTLEADSSLRHTWETKTADALAAFSPEVLLGLIVGKVGRELVGKTRRNQLGSRDNWTPDEKAEVVRRFLEAGSNPDGLAILEVNDLPLPFVEEHKAQFFTAYLRRNPEKILANAEFFEDLVRERGETAEALSYLDSRKPTPLAETPHVQFPAQHEVEAMPPEQVLEQATKNHARLLEKMKQLGPKNLPYYGLSGGAKPEVFLGRAAADERLYLQFVTALEETADPNLALIDLYDNIGGDKSYFAHPGSTLFVMDIVNPSIKRSHDYWGREGEFKNWRININLGGNPLGLARDMSAVLSPEMVQCLAYFEETKGGKRRPHAEKTSREYPTGTSKEEMGKRLLARIDADDTPLYLLKKDYQIRIDDPEAGNKIKRQFFTEVLYVQAVADKILDALLCKRE